MSRRRDKLIRRTAEAQEQRTQLIRARQTWQAPLPPPEALERFNQIVPGSAERILSMAEGHARDGWANNRFVRRSTILGQVFAFTLALVALVGGLTLIWTGRPTAGLAAVITALGIPLLAMFGRKAPRKT